MRNPVQAACSFSIGPALLILLLLYPACGGGVNLELSRTFQEAQELYNTASSEEEFLQSAMLYQQVLDRGLTSSAVLYNMGNAFMNADKRGLAIAAYRQAQRYRPRDPFLDANLRYALGQDAAIERGRTLVDHLLFWQDWLSYPEKCHLFILFGALALFCSLIGLYARRKPVWKRLMWGALLLTLISVISASYDWYRFQWIRMGVITEAEVIARKGNSDSYQPAFTEALTEGVEFRIMDRREEWLLIRMRGGLEGWIPAEDTATY